MGEHAHAFANSRAQLAMDWELGWVASSVFLGLLFLRASWIDLNNALQPKPKFGSHGGKAQRGGQPEAAQCQHEQVDASQS